MEDAGFVNVVVTPLESDRVFIHCLGGEDIWKVFNDAIHFFGMLFKDLHKWSTKDDNYERGRGYVFMGLQCKFGMNSFSNYVCRVVEDLSVRMIVRLIGQDWTMHVFLFLLLIWRL